MIALPRTFRFRVLASPISGVGLALICTAGVFLSGTTLRAQTARTGLISQAVDESARVVLSGNVPRLATRAADRGAVAPSMSASRMLLLLKRSPEQELALQAEIESLHDSNSPNFHKWLTPQQFGAQWGAADSDIAAVTAWLEAHGFEVRGATAGRTAIEYSGTAGQIQEAFHTSIHSYQVNGALHHANAADPQIPAALAPVVAGISTLNDFHPHSLVRKGPRGIYDRKTNRSHPELTDSSSFGDFLYVGPADAATIYNSPIKALNPAATGATIDGTGAAIGIIGDSNISTSQNAHYSTLFGLSAKKPIVIVDGVNPGENGDAIEAYLDTEVAGGIAPGAQVYFYTAADTDVDYGVDLATSRAVNDNLVDVLNLSFGECEGGLGTSGNQFYESIWEQAAAQGISVTVSTGDSGSAGCDDPNTQSLAYYGLQVNGLASTPYDIAVGGTDFAVLAGPNGDGADFLNYVSENSDSTTLRSALGAIPEVPWNDSQVTFPPGPISASSAFPAPYANIVASGGGKSTCTVGGFNSEGNLVCTSSYAKPSWQSAPGVIADHHRDIPDVAMFAANGLNYASWAICTDQDQDTAGSPIADCTPGSNGLPPDEFYVYGVGGTSASAPAFAGVLALIRQSTGERQGQADYVLYNLARSKPTTFRDMRTGNNSVPCASGTPNCGENAVGADLLTGYNATAGYDLASGLGSVDVSALVANWANAGLSATTTHLALSPTTIQHGQIVVVNATVTGSGPISGGVALAATANPPSFPIGSSIGLYPIKSAGSTGNVNVNNLPGGSYKVTASYAGSAALSQSQSSPITVNVTPESSAVEVEANAYNPNTEAQAYGSSVPYGYYIDFFATPYGQRSPVVNGQVHPDGTATGKVTFTQGPAPLGTEPVGLNGYAGIEGSMLSPGKYAVKAAYGGDASLDPSTGTYPLTVIKATTQISLAASTTTYVNKPITFTMVLSTASAGVAPTGSVALKTGSTTLAEVTLDGSSRLDSGLAAGTATITTSNLPHGTTEIYAVYQGDVNYASSTSASLKVKGKSTFTIADNYFSLPAEHSTGGGYIVSTSVDGYAGTLNLTCKLAVSVKTTTPPECGFYPNTATLAKFGTAKTLMLIFGKGTTLPTGVTLGSNDPAHSSGSSGSMRMGLGAGGAVLACVLLFGVPARRRSWRSMLSVILLLAAVTGFSACSAPPKMITAGQYTFTVTGTDSNDSTITSTATIKVRVL